jgi:hypothetical protein
MRYRSDDDGMRKMARVSEDDGCTGEVGGIALHGLQLFSSALDAR